MLKVQDLVNCSVEELKTHYKDVCRDIFELTNKLRLSRNLDKPHKLKEKRRDRARVLTILRQKRGLKE